MEFLANQLLIFLLGCRGHKFEFLGQEILTYAEVCTPP